MGTYVYTFRKASRNIIVDGQKDLVQHLAYAYKHMSPLGRGRPTYLRYITSMKSHAERSFGDYDGGYIVIYDVKVDGKRTDLDGVEVYRGLTRFTWIDSNDHGMELVGKLKRIGRSYHLIKNVPN